MKALAAIQKQGGRAALTIGLRTLSLSRLTEHARAALANLPTTVLIEVELQGDEVTAIGDVKPHPRVV